MIRETYLSKTLVYNGEQLKTLKHRNNMLQIRIISLHGKKEMWDYKETTEGSAYHIC